MLFKELISKLENGTTINIFIEKSPYLTYTIGQQNPLNYSILSEVMLKRSHIMDGVVRSISLIAKEVYDIDKNEPSTAPIMNVYLSSEGGSKC